MHQCWKSLICQKRTISRYSGRFPLVRTLSTSNQESSSLTTGSDIDSHDKVVDDKNVDAEGIGGMDEANMEPEKLDSGSPNYYRLSELGPFWQDVRDDSYIRVDKIVQFSDTTHERLARLLKNFKLEQLATYHEKYTASMLANDAKIMKNVDIEPVRYSAKRTLAYCAFDMAASHAILQRIFSDIQVRAGEYKIFEGYKTMLDFGSGPGTATIVAQSHCPNLDSSTHIEPSRSMWDSAVKLIHGEKDYSRPVEELVHEMKTEAGSHLGLVWSPSLPEFLQGYQKADDYPKFDIVTCTFTLRELESYTQRAVALSYLWKMVEPHGMLILAERGDAVGTRLISEARSFLLSKDSENAQALQRVLGFHPFEDSISVFAPCTHSRPCPFVTNTAPEGRFKDKCIFSQSGQRTITRSRSTGQGRGKAESGYQYSYVVFQKADIEPNTSLARILRPPLKRKDHLFMDICNGDGEILRESITKRKAKKTPVYRICRKAEWGGLWTSGLLKPFEQLEEDDDDDTLEDEEEEENVNPEIEK